MIFRTFPIGLLLCAVTLSRSPSAELRAGSAQAKGPKPVLPVLDFPEPGLDDPAAYQGYQTRFYRDSKQNTVQVYLEPRGGRVVTLWADAANESAGFTVRDAAGRPTRLTWGAAAAEVADGEQSYPLDSASGADSGKAFRTGPVRSIEYRLVTDASRIELGGFLLGSMRVERDYQYAKRHLKPLTLPPFRVAEESLLVADVARLPGPERGLHLALLGAASLETLRSRLGPTLGSACSDTLCTVRVERPSFDAGSRLILELAVDSRRVKVQVSGQTVSIRTRPGAPIKFAVKVTTDAEPLTPLQRTEIFNPAFLKFLADAAVAADTDDHLRYRRMERQVRGVELLSTEEKLMAGLPNFATYFGRDMMMTALMMRPIWTAGMSEHVIASVLRKLGPRGDVSHEEALGGQAIRENAVVYDSLITRYFRAVRARQQQADSLLEQARAVLGELQKTRENYHMIDDEFQLPVLTARYLGDPEVPARQKRAFLLDSSTSGEPRLALMLREMALVATWTAPYVQDPRPSNLVSFPRRDATHWRSASWRDSDAGYAGGRFAMDVNAIWAPQALESIGLILAALPKVGITKEEIDLIASTYSGTPLAQYLTDPASLDRAIETWKGARRHFEVRLGPAQVRQRVRAKLAWLPPVERRYWQKIMAERGSTDSLSFLALSLDAGGKPIPVVNTDPATGLFLGSTTEPEIVLGDVAPFALHYPVGLLVDSLGPLVANDAYASRQIWDRFRADTYHSPRVVWGREVNLLFLGLANRIKAALDGAGRPRDPGPEPYVGTLQEVLQGTTAAVEASGLGHNELWSYRIEGGRLLPIRYGTSSDVQLWNTTDLAVEFALSRLPATESLHNMLTPQEREAGWRLLFDGKTTAGWRGYRQKAMPAGWQVIDGALTRVDSAGDIVTSDQYANFELALEWRVAEGGNSGIFYRASEDSDYVWRSGVEMQVLDDARHPDGRSPLTSAGALYGIYPAPRGVVRPAGEWNLVRIVVNGHHVEHWLNGVKVVEAELGSPDWERRVKQSKFATMPRYGRNDSGHIGLQDHGDRVSYRNIKVHVLR